MGVRRVVTGVSSDGRSIVVSDSLVEGSRSNLLQGGEITRLWFDGGTDADELGGVRTDWEPGPGEIRFGLFTVPPRATAEPDAGLVESMHATSSIDFVVVLEGELTLIVGDGPELKLHPGDTVVQQGSVHAWANRGERAARAAVCLVGA
jgi:hypothetical protein